jgi:hypothetical protein
MAASSEAVNGSFPEVAVRFVSGGIDGNVGWQVSALERQEGEPAMSMSFM